MSTDSRGIKIEAPAHVFNQSGIRNESWLFAVFWQLSWATSTYNYFKSNSLFFLARHKVGFVVKFDSLLSSDLGSVHKPEVFKANHLNRKEV